MNIKNIFTLTILCKTILLLSSQTPCEIYVENYYGAPIICTVNNTKEIPIEKDCPPVKLPARITALSLKSTSRFASSTPLEKLLEQISQEKEQNRNKKAVLIVKQSGYLSDWDIKLAWYPQHTFLTKFSMETTEDEAQTQERQFQTKQITTEQFLLLIKNNLYGQEYAEKITALSEVDYESARRNNKKDIHVHSLLHSFGYPTLVICVGSIQESYQRYLNNPDAEYTQQGNRDPEEVQTLVKTLIDSQYEKFLLYKESGWLQETE